MKTAIHREGTWHVLNPGWDINILKQKRNPVYFSFLSLWFVCLEVYLFIFFFYIYSLSKKDQIQAWIKRSHVLFWPQLFLLPVKQHTFHTLPRTGYTRLVATFPGAVPSHLCWALTWHCSSQGTCLGDSPILTETSSWHFKHLTACRYQYLSPLHCHASLCSF